VAARALSTKAPELFGEVICDGYDCTFQPQSVVAQHRDVCAASQVCALDGFTFPTHCSWNPQKEHPTQSTINRGARTSHTHAAEPSSPCFSVKGSSHSTNDRHSAQQNIAWKSFQTVESLICTWSRSCELSDAHFTCDLERDGWLEEFDHSK
jgi:hypothetical protein